MNIQDATTATIRQALGVLTAPGSVVELRIPGDRIRSGYFDDLDLAAKAATQLNGTSSVYQTLNPVDPSLLARAVNRIIIVGRKPTTSDRDILRRLWLPLDYDPVRASEISSTDAQHEAALARAREVLAYLRSLGWPDPVIADSGNGAHSLYRIDLPNNAESTELLKRCLQALSLRFSDDAVKVDEAVFNPARIWKVYGTIACKGDSTAERPHRQSKLLQVPDELEAVSLDKLKALADTVPKPSQRDAGYSGKQFDLDQWISDHRLDVVGPDPWGGGGRKWIFRACPWNDAHGDRSAYIVQHPGGAIAAGCHHDSCQGNIWESLRALYEPEHRKGGTKKGPKELPEPQPLTAKVTPEPYPLDALPEIVRESVMEVQDFVKAPVPLVASSAMASMSMVTQAHIDVRRADKLEGPTGLFLLSIADSGERKTTCDNFFTKVIREYDAPRGRHRQGKTQEI